MQFSLDGNAPTFQEWLCRNYNVTSRELYATALATGTYNSYNKLMDWYRKRYRYEMEQRELLKDACPFD